MRRAGAKVFLVYNSEILLILRDNKPSIPFPNTWDLPGGGIEQGESAEQALRRELKEEINIALGKITYLGEQSWDDGSKDGGIISHHFAKLTKDEFEVIKLGKEGQRLDFFSLQKLTGLNLVRYLDEYLFKHEDELRQLIEK